jgi:hypothetical protein
MRRIKESSFALRVSLLTAFIVVIAAVLPLVALAGTGDPLGS